FGGGSRKSERDAGQGLSGGGAAPFSPVRSSTASVKLLPKNSMTKSTGPPPLLWLCLYHLFPRTVKLSCRFQRYSFPARVSCSPVVVKHFCNISFEKFTMYVLLQMASSNHYTNGDGSESTIRTRIS